ncbi:IS3 family transposase [Streptomyces sp. NPDC048243]|uniref:IS3 family transposase n=1 Tax=Streptomyces sp. NPDC048243 TaxID=3365522 RepID=UPI00371CF682
MIEHLRDKGLEVGFACRVLAPPESAYYVRKKRPKSACRLRDEQLMPPVEQVHAESGGIYGVRRITRALRRKGVRVARCTVERLMAELGLEGAHDYRPGRKHRSRQQNRLPDHRRPAFLARAMKAPALLDAADRLAERTREESWTHAEYLVACLQREVSAHASHGGEARVRAARFPAIKTMEEPRTCSSSSSRTDTNARP